MGTPEKEWEKELLRVAKEVVKHGWGEVRMIVSKPISKDIPEITISDTTTTRFKKTIDKTEKVD